ncbi:MAG: methylated-DNA--[protein]-cysteine S-methyltransferase [Candidatus Dadabacteria bacterium]|nr:methylated-DNA--[protein]-cysteine S-methyltransferase [Candidatus Dadabacteria bacterium]
MKYNYTVMKSSVGKITLVADNVSLRAIYWLNQKPDRVKFPDLENNDSNHVLKSAVKQLKAYFSGTRREFDIPLRPVGTVFQEEVWLALRSISYGETVSYSDIAKQIGRPKAVRAVGAAIGKNPLSIMIPCHRVIGANGKLIGFAGGLSTKEFLLNLEDQTDSH